VDSAKAHVERIPFDWGLAVGDLEAQIASLEALTRVDAGNRRRFIGPQEYLDVWSPEAAPLRADPRFRSWVDSMGLDDAWRETGWPAACQPVGESFICR
jgi:hypothetical protein